MRLFLDANILFTASHNPVGKAAFVIELGAHGHWEVYSSTYAVAEASRNLARKYPQMLNNLTKLLRGVKLAEQRSGLDYPEGLVEKDQPIYQAAVACNATHLLTGDLKDFGPFMNQTEKTSGICIQTVADFLKQLS